MSTILDQSRTATQAADSSVCRTVEDLVRTLGDIPLSRIRMVPAPGTATEADVLSVDGPTCELMDGTLVEKGMGFFEGRLATILLVLIEHYLTGNDIGFTNGEGSYTKFGPAILIPDVSFFRWDRVNEHRVPESAICEVIPTLTVEVISQKNTRAEIERKRAIYFNSGVAQVWIVDPRKQEVAVWESSQDCHIYGIGDSISGGEILPGFELSIQGWFDRASKGM